MRRYQLNPPHRETKFTISDLTIYDREDNEIIVDVEFEYEWTEKAVINLNVTNVATKQDVLWFQEGKFYECQIDNLYHECHEHVANRCENTEL